MKLDLDKIKSPGCEYRSLSFWAWNDELEEKEIERQIKEMHKGGVGGFFMHSREGLETMYMGEKWKHMIRIAVQKAEKYGMQAWLYDEDRWPSGSAGGRVAAEWGDMARCKGLTIEVCDKNSEEWMTDGSLVLAVYTAAVKQMDIEWLRRMKDGEFHKDGNVLLVVRLEISGKSEWFNNEAPPDNLNVFAVRHFLEATHDKYKQIAGDMFGDTVPGIFTDEPSLHDRHASFQKNRGWIPWTAGFENYFKKQRGYDVFDYIPYLFFNGSRSTKIRHDYWRTAAFCFAESYSGEISNWCKENGLAYTGHFLQEDKLGLSTRVNGGGIMQHYRFQDIPGIDMLCERTEEYITVKQCSSVAHQFNKPVVLSESFGCTGWEFNFEGQKWVGDWQYALGVNRLSRHLALYSIRGCRKRDYPPSFHCNTTWWEYARIMEDYFGRLSAALIPGKAVQDVLVIHPHATAWSQFGCNPYGNPVRRNERDLKPIDEYGAWFNEFLCYLSGIHYDYDLGDEEILKDYAVSDGYSFRVGEAEYKIIILPALDTIFSSTLALLRKFMDNGGHVVVLKKLPFMLEGENSDLPKKVLTHRNMHLIQNITDTEKTLESILKRRVSIQNTFGFEDTNILYLLKRYEESSYVLFVVNNDRHNEHTVKITIKGKVQNIDLLTGETADIPKVNNEISENLGPADSRLYYIKEAEAGNGEKRAALSRFYTSFSPVCAIRRNMPNVLTLDKCRWNFEGEVQSDLMEVWQAQYQIRSELGMRQIHLNGGEQRYKWIHKPHRNDGRKVTFEFRFCSGYSAENAVVLIERAGDYTVMFNGRQVVSSGEEWFLDKNFIRTGLPAFKAGENILTLSCEYKNSMEAEDIYLLGDFAVSTDRVLIQEKGRIAIGDWTTQGYLHYPGSLSYLYEMDWKEPESKEVELRIPDFVATTVCVKVNGHKQNVPWRAASTVNITKYLLQGKNEIEIEVVSSPRNMLGPFHLAEGKTFNTHDESFRSMGSNAIDGYHVHPYGLYGAPKIYVTLKNCSI